jgi:NADH-quinone oxidoreductase subunit J
MIFSVLLIHHIEMELEVAKLFKKIITAIACLAGLGIFLTTIYSHQFNVIENANSITINEIGKGFLSYEAGGFILPFEVISILLLAAMIGAIVIAKGTKATPTPPKEGLLSGAKTEN